MDMDMGGMSMGGMDMSSVGMFLGMNEALAHGFWYGIVAIVALLLISRVLAYAERKYRLGRAQKDPQCVPSRPRGLVSQAHATVTAFAREMSYPQPIYFTGRVSKFFSPMPVGNWLLLAVYWTVILIFLWNDTILRPSDPQYAYKWEKVGFRAAWVTVTQIPFIYLLSMKLSPVSLLTGASYERINWLHRWAARTVFLTAIVHWSYFLREWWIADFVELEIQMMPMVKYGFGAFGTVAWMVLSGFGFFRAMSYEIFVLQHIAAAAVLLWLLFSHVPGYAKYNIYMSIGFFAFDFGFRIIWNTVRNTHLLHGFRAPGYSTKLEALPGDMIRLTIEDADFSWKAGQHAFLTVPRLRPLELHPFTIANAAAAQGTAKSRKLSMLIKAHHGFSKSLHRAALKSDRTYRAFLSGPWGMPPSLSHYDTVVLVACASGASFTVPLLEELVGSPGCVRRIRFHWIVRAGEHISWFSETLASVKQVAQSAGLDLQIVIHITGGSGQVSTRATASGTKGAETIIEMQSRGSSSSASMSSAEDEKAPLSARTPSAAGLPATFATTHHGRPTVEAMVRPPVEAAYGETAVVVCGGLAVTAQARTFVSKLSDERAVHKGTGAQGIFLFTETYGW